MNNLPQLSAADPKTSVWVSASAGTGKNKSINRSSTKAFIRRCEP